MTELERRRDLCSLKIFVDNGEICGEHIKAIENSSLIFYSMKLKSEFGMPFYLSVYPTLSYGGRTSWRKIGGLGVASFEDIINEAPTKLRDLLFYNMDLFE